MKKEFKCLIGLHKYEVWNYDGYAKLLLCKKCEKVKTIRIKKCK